jgi:hypothetical protein
MAAVWEIGIPWRAVESMEFVCGSTYSQDGHSLPSMFHFRLEDKNPQRRVLVAKFGVDLGGWHTNPTRGSHGYGLWKGIMLG